MQKNSKKKTKYREKKTVIHIQKYAATDQNSGIDAPYNITGCCLSVKTPDCDLACRTYTKRSELRDSCVRRRESKYYPACCFFSLINTVLRSVISSRNNHNRRVRRLSTSSRSYSSQTSSPFTSNFFLLSK